MRTVGLLLVGFGAAILIAGVGLYTWAHWLFTVGSAPLVLEAAAALPGAAVIGLGALLVRSGDRRSKTN